MTPYSLAERRVDWLNSIWILISASGKHQSLFLL